MDTKEWGQRLLEANGERIATVRLNALLPLIMVNKIIGSWLPWGDGRIKRLSLAGYTAALVRHDRAIIAAEAEQ